MKTVLTLILFIFSLSPLAANKAAKVIILRGSVKAFTAQQEKGRSLKKGDWVSEGEIVKCGAKSFAKLLFIDKSQLNISPNSEMRVKAFPRNKAGIISLIKGKIRAKVTKNYMEINPKESKLFIKTKTAAMGVRGTDFQVIYNPRNKVTSLVTFEGAVAMAKINQKIGQVRQEQRSLERLLNRKEAVVVRRGQFSGANPKKKRVSLPVKISPAQLDSMRSNDEASVKKPTKKGSQKRAKVVRSIVPKGLDPKKLAKANESGVDKLLGQGNIVEVEKVAPVVPPEGLNDKSTGAHAPAAGGFVDTKTGLYVPPTEGSSYDANADVYVPPPEVGSVDPDTGNYIPPAGFVLTDSGGFKATGGARGPASVDTTSLKVEKINVLKESPLLEKKAPSISVKPEVELRGPGGLLPTTDAPRALDPPVRLRIPRPRVKVRLRREATENVSP